MGEERCQRCGEHGWDRRTLVMRCLYEMNELNIPFELKDNYYTLRVCKECRADWMKSIKHWFDKKPILETYTERVPWEICDVID